MSSKQGYIRYSDAGVDITAGNALIDRIKPLAAMTKRTGANTDLGGFGGMFDLKAAGFKDPVLVSGTDGVGTKLKLAIKSGIHTSIGQDLVAMCANDILAQGALPLFFLDYFACSKLDNDVAEQVVSGIARGCQLAGAALIGGETAEMPGLYSQGDYDLAGFIVGAVERNAILPDHKRMQAGDILIGLPSSGVHSNGYSLVHKLVEKSGLDWQSKAPFSQMSMLDIFLEPTYIYVQALKPLLEAGLVKGAAHITGGGLKENPPRMCPDHLHPFIDYQSWSRPAVFEWLAEIGPVSEDEMRRTFNLGIGMVICICKTDTEQVLDLLEHAGEQAYIIGRLEAR